MEHPRKLLLILLSCVAIFPLTAQTQIGGGTCSSASVNGTYAVTITGRKVTPLAAFTNVFQAIGSATFDGQSKVTFALTSDTNQAVETQSTWSGTYSVQANCVGLATISTGGSASLNIVAYAQGADFLLTGSDANYSYSGFAHVQPSSCSTGTFSGVYTVNAAGFALTSNAVSGAASGAGLLQFDGQGHLTVNYTLSTSGAAANPLTLTGSYSVGPNCFASAALTDAKGNAYVMRFSVVTGNAMNSSTLYLMLAQNSGFIVIGSAHVIYGQPTATVLQNSGNGERA